MTAHHRRTLLLWLSVCGGLCPGMLLRTGAAEPSDPAERHAAQATSALALCACPSPPANLLTIWTARWCAPCRSFWADYANDRQFREALQQRWHVHAVDVDLHPDQVTAAWVVSVPTFDVRERRITGYQGKAWLLGQLAEARSSAPAPRAETTSPPSGREDGDKEVATPAPARSRAPALPVPGNRSPDNPAPDNPAPHNPAPHNPAPHNPAPHNPAPHNPAPHNPAPHNPAPSLPADTRPPSLLSRCGSALRTTTPIVLTGLELLGVIGGTAATGGLGAAGVAVVVGLLRRRWRRRPGESAALERGPTLAGGDGPLPRAPFPRELDEARQLVELRQSEGRVAVLDALRGMFFDDEAERLTESGDPQATAIVQRLKAAIDTRVDEVAPLSTSYAPRSPR